jgi:hypothetical protein
MTVSRTLPAAALLVALAAAPALAASTVGSRLDARADFSTSCRAAGCTLAAGATVPSSGVVVRWRLRSATTGVVRLRVLRAAGDALETVAVGASQRLGHRHAPGRDVTYVFTTRLTVEKGDELAVDTGHGAAAVLHRRPGASGVELFTPSGAVGAPMPVPAQLNGAELLMNADVEPDADGDGYGDETQDNCPTIANDQTSNPCPSAAVTPTPTPSGNGDTGGAPPRTTGWRRHKHVRAPFSG